jgi:hypothetical protein
MKKIATVFGTLVFVATGTMAPTMAQIRPQVSDTELKSDQPLTNNSGQYSRKMAIYSDCIQTHSNVSGADFKQMNKFCSCVADQSIQGTEGTFSSCAEGSGGGSTMGMLGEVAPAVITGVIEGISNRNSSKEGGLLGKGGGLLNGLGGLLGGGLLGGGDSDGGFNIKDILKGRL